LDSGLDPQVSVPGPSASAKRPYWAKQIYWVAG